MEGIVLTDEDLKILEKRLGPDLRKMGPWMSDGTFGYCWVSMGIVEKAAEALEDPNLMMALFRLKNAPERAQLFIALLESFGHPLIERIVAAYRQGSLEVMGGIPLRKNPPERQAIKAMAAAG